MLTSALYGSVRYRLPDESFSPYQIVDALNYVVNEISLALNGITSSILTAPATLTITAGVATLPTDFESMISVGDVDAPLTLIPADRELDAFAYQIVGNTMHVEGITVDIFYRKFLPSYSFDGTITPTTIDLPTSFNNLLVDSVIMRCNGESVNAQQQALRLIASRDGKKRPRNLIFNL